MEHGQNHHYSTGAQSVRIGNTGADVESKANNYFEENIVSEDAENMAEKGNACDDCGLLFDSTHDVQRHVKRGWCPENNEPPAKKMKLEEQEPWSIDDNIEDNDGYLSLWENARSANEEKYDKFYNQFIAEESEENAEELAEERTRPYEERTFYTKYETLLDNYWLPLETSSLHNKIIKEVKGLVAKGVGQTSAIKRAVKKYKHEFQDLFETELSEDEDSETEDESETEN